MKKLISALVFVTAAAAFAGSASAESLLVADFNSGSKPNNLGGDFGSWSKDEADKTQGCKMSFNSAITHDGKGYSVQLDYDVDSPKPAYSGFWMKLQNQDVSQYSKLSLWVKGNEAVGFSPKVKLELKNAKGEVGKYTITNITDKWQEIVTPLNQIGLTDKTAVSEFVIVFDDVTCAGKKVGTIYIQDVAFVK